jgi:hypothetical protein
MQSASVVLSSVACPTVQLFPHYLIYGTVLKKLQKLQCVFRVYFQFLSETFPIVRIVRDVNNVYWSLCKVHIIILRF